jgi:hypothetical protein
MFAAAVGGDQKRVVPVRRVEQRGQGVRLMMVVEEGLRAVAEALVAQQRG